MDANSSIQSINSPLSINSINSRLSINANNMIAKDLNIIDYDYCPDIKYFVINRLTYLIFNDLFWYNYENNSIKMNQIVIVRAKI